MSNQVEVSKVDRNHLKLNGGKASWNVVDGDTYKAVIREVFQSVAERISFTMGPYGGDTVFEHAGQTYMTKDGWTVLKNISYDNPVYNSILNLLKNVSAPVVIKVGDGSSSAVCAANNIYNNLMEAKILSKYRPKDVVKTMEDVCETICDEILKRSIKIDPDGDLEEIYKIALTSTNQNDLFASTILDIYKQTGNSTIELIESKGSKTSYEIINGFKGNGMYLDRAYQTSDDGRCVIENPVVLAFDFKIDENEYEAVIKPTIQKALAENRRAVVFAPYYSDSLLEKIRYLANQELKSTGKTTVVYCRVPIVAQDMIENYNDFIMMLGGTMITQTVMVDLLPKFEVDPKTRKRVKIEDAKMIPTDCIGTCATLTVSDKYTMIDGINNRKEAEYNLILQDVKAQLKTANEDSENLNIVSNRSFSLKKRLSKLEGSMGVIYVGGRSMLEKRANMDALDDAIKACESAYIYGYNIGGSLIIPIVCKHMATSGGELETALVSLISRSMTDVYRQVLNKYYSKEEDEEVIDAIIEKCLETEEIFDLIDKDYSRDVVNPCMTDIEVLKASTTMSSLLISSNQYISIAPSEDIF